MGIVHVGDIDIAAPRAHIRAGPIHAHIVDVCQQSTQDRILTMQTLANPWQIRPTATSHGADIGAARTLYLCTVPDRAPAQAAVTIPQ